MKEKVKKVRLLEYVDAETIAVDKDHYFNNAYVIDLPLATVPDHVWQDILDRQWKSSRHLWDRKLFVIGDKLRLVTTMDDIKDKLEWVKQIVDQTNRSIDEYNVEAEAREIQMEEAELARAYEQKKSDVDVIRENLRKRVSSG